MRKEQETKGTIAYWTIKPNHLELEEREREKWNESVWWDCSESKRKHRVEMEKRFFFFFRNLSDWRYVDDDERVFSRNFLGNASSRSNLTKSTMARTYQDFSVYWNDVDSTLLISLFWSLEQDWIHWWDSQWNYWFPRRTIGEKIESYQRESTGRHRWNPKQASLHL